MNFAERRRSDDVGHFSAAPIKIKGGAYPWVDDGDGYKTIIGLPLVSEFEKGTKGAPYEGNRAKLEEFVKVASTRYQDGHYCAKAFKHHNPDTELGQKPELLGYALPTHVGTAKTQRGEKLAVFGNVKVNEAGFEAIKAGKLPGVSPEIRWSENKITGLAFLDTEEPHNEFPLVTLGDEIKDATGKFKFDPKDEPEESTMTAEEIKKLIGETVAEGIAKFAADQKKAADDAKAKADEDAKRGNPTAGKPSATPANPHDEPPTAAKTSAADAAKMTALENDNALFKAKFAEMENAKKTDALMTKAERELSTKIVTTEGKSHIAKFAASCASQKDGETEFMKYVADLKPMLKDKPTVNGSGGSGVPAVADVSDPVVAKFAKDGADLGDVARFSAKWDELKRVSGDHFRTGREDFIKNELAIAAAERKGAFSEFTTRR